MSNSSKKHCDYTFALSNIEQAEKIITYLPDFDIWAYIRHIPDDDNTSDHYHFYIHLKQPISISNLSEKLEIPQNMLEWVRVKTRLIQYLIHKNNPEKTQYLPENIITNDREYITRFLEPESSKVDLHSESYDLQKLISGQLSPDQYIELHSNFIASLPFYSRQLFLMRVIQLGKEGYSARMNQFSSGRVV